MISRPLKRLLSLEESLALEAGEADALYAAHLNPGLLKIYRALGLSPMDVESAEGVEIRLKGGGALLDFSSAIGVLGLGHNHPRIIGAERQCHARKVLDAIKVAPHKLQGALAYNLAQWLPDPLEVAFFSVSGAEAVEAAMKLCEKARGPTKTRFITLSGAFHGKTHGALSVTTAGGFQRGFLLGIPRENVLEAEYGNLDALEEILKKEGSRKNHSVIALIVEPITGEGVVEPPLGYLPGVARICREYGILTIFDEVKVGMGRTGTFCAFQKEEVVPDVVTLSKALGGGKRAIGAMVSSQALFHRAYGKRKDCSLHTSTFSGLGETCAVAIEALNVYADENLLERAKERGAYLRRGLEVLQNKHRGKIIELRGRGLFQGVRFHFGHGILKKEWTAAGFFQTVESAFMASIVRALYKRHGILAHFSASSPDVLHVMPPLIVENRHLDAFVSALDDILSRGFVKVAAEFVKGNLEDRLRK